MDFLATGGIVVLLLVLLGVALVGTLVTMLIMRAWVKVARADEALVISGKAQKGDDGTEAPVTVIVNGKAMVNPVTQRHEVISLRSRQVTMRAAVDGEDVR